jgi:hypothetical protein
VSLPAPDQPDDINGHQDPFVNAVRIWASLEAMRANGFPQPEMEEVIRSMDAVMIRHRQVLIEQYTRARPVFRTRTLLRRLGLEYWSDGELLAQNDPDRKTT